MDADLRRDCRLKLEQRLQHAQRVATETAAKLEGEARREYERVLQSWEASSPRELVAQMPPEQKVVIAADYVREPVDLRTFVYDDAYMGRVMRGDVYPRIVDDLEELFAGEYSEVVLGGSIGWGKTRFMEIALAYDLYLLSCLRDPAKAYGMMSGSNMTFINVSVNVTQARNVFFRDFYNIIKSSPYFRRVFPYDKHLKNELHFPKKNVSCYPVAASEQAALGVGVFCAAIDEANFMQIVERSKRRVPGENALYDQAQVVFNKLKQRMRSRMNQRGKLPGHIYVSSSARYPGDMTERMERLAREEAEQGEHHIFVRHYARWDTPPPGKYQRATFRVEVGDLTRRSRVLDGTETDVNRGRVIEVPMDFHRDFVRAPDECVRDHAGISTLSIKPFIVKREMIHKMFERGKRAGMKHAFSTLEATLQHKDPQAERLLPEHLHWSQRPRLGANGRPLFGPDGEKLMEPVLYPALYCGHMDLSKTGDATGLAVGHIVGSKLCDRFNEDTGVEQKEEKPLIRLDLVQRIVPPINGEIDIPRVRALFYQLRREGMEFGLITCDQFGSPESIKTLKEKGYPADEFSVDRNKDAYSALKDALYDERVLCAPNPVLERELGQLEDTGKKIDHPTFPGASKDLADCVAAVVHHCEELWRHGRGVGSLFKVGEVEHRGGLPEAVIDRMQTARAQVVAGQPLAGQAEDDLLFAPYVQDLLKTDAERFGTATAPRPEDKLVEDE